MATKRTLLNTGIYIPPQYWHPKQLRVSPQLPAEYGTPVKLNDELLRHEKYRQENITFASFDFNFYHDFIDYLTFEHVHLRRQEVLTVGE